MFLCQLEKCLKNNLIGWKLDNLMVYFHRNASILQFFTDCCFSTLHYRSCYGNGEILVSFKREQDISPERGVRCSSHNDSTSRNEPKTFSHNLIRFGDRSVQFFLCVCRLPTAARKEPFIYIFCIEVKMIPKCC